jgi:hypothetical protein
MRMIKTIAFVLFIFVYAGCERDEIKAGSEIKFEFGQVCGWCAGEEFITITSKEINYERKIPCGEGKGTTKKSSSISSSEWNKIISSFNMNEFKTLEYNTCNVCVDGCDEIIRITENNDTYEIRYSPSDKIQETENLRHDLSELMEKMKMQR